MTNKPVINAVVITPRELNTIASFATGFPFPVGSEPTVKHDDHKRNCSKSVGKFIIAKIDTNTKNIPNTINKRRAGIPYLLEKRMANNARMR